MPSSSTRARPPIQTASDAGGASAACTVWSCTAAHVKKRTTNVHLSTHDPPSSHTHALGCRDACPYEVRGGSETKAGKANILLQAYISRVRVESFSLTADLNYVASNAPR